MTAEVAADRNGVGYVIPPSESYVPRVDWVFAATVTEANDLIAARERDLTRQRRVPLLHGVERVDDGAAGWIISRPS